jgi:hypothetical protein
MMLYRVIIQTAEENRSGKREFNKTEDTIDDCLDVLRDWVPNIIQRKNIVNIQIARED